MGAGFFFFAATAQSMKPLLAVPSFHARFFAQCEPFPSTNGAALVASGNAASGLTAGYAGTPTTVILPPSSARYPSWPHAFPPQHTPWASPAFLDAGRAR